LAYFPHPLRQLEMTAPLKPPLELPNIAAAPPARKQAMIPAGSHLAALFFFGCRRSDIRRSRLYYPFRITLAYFKKEKSGKVRAGSRQSKNPLRQLEMTAPLKPPLEFLVSFFTGVACVFLFPLIGLPVIVPGIMACFLAGMSLLRHPKKKRAAR
jgi:hypothetical protein